MKRITAEKALKHEYFMESPIPDKNSFRCENETDFMYPPRALIAGKTVPPTQKQSTAEPVQNMPPPYPSRGRGRGRGVTGGGSGNRGRGRGRQTTGTGRGRGRGTTINTRNLGNGTNSETEAKTYANYTQMYAQPGQQEASYNYRQPFNQSQFF